VNVLLAVLDMMSVGAAGGVGGKTILLYLCTTVMAGIIGVISTLIFKPWYTVGETGETSDAYIQLGCSLQDETDGPSYLVVNSTTGEVVCDSAANYDEYDVQTLWTFNDVNNSFVMNNGATVEDVSLSDTVYDGVFMKLITE
jgi:hypothetical protein